MQNAFTMRRVAETHVLQLLSAKESPPSLPDYLLVLLLASQGGEAWAAQKSAAQLLVEALLQAVD